MKFVLAALSITFMSQASFAQIEQRPMEPTAAIQQRLNEPSPSSLETRNAIVSLNDELKLGLSSEQISDIAAVADSELSRSIVALNDGLPEMKSMYLKFGKKLSEDGAYSKEVREILLSTLSSK